MSTRNADICTAWGGMPPSTTFLNLAGPGGVVKTDLLRLILEGEGGRSKKSDISHTATEIGLEAPVSLGFRYYMGR